MDEHSNVFGKSAKYYDMDDRESIREDVAFYLKAAEKIGRNIDILELACGTGRVSIPLAEAGHNVAGLDLSGEMLDVFREKTGSLDRETAGRIEIVKASMTDFSFNRKFDLIIVPFRSFQALVREEEVMSCLLTVYRHLKSGGSFIVDVFNPYRRPLDSSWLYPRTLLWEKRDCGKTIRRYHRGEGIDTEKQVIYPVLEFEITDADGTVVSYEDRLALKYYYPEQLREILEGAGFEIIAADGDYKGGMIGDGSPEIIYTCGKVTGAGGLSFYVIAV